MAEQTEVKKRRGRPPWTEEQKEAFRRKRAEMEARGEIIKRGPGGRQNFPQFLGVGESTEDKQMISRLLGEARIALKQPKPKSDDELEARIDGYFEHCQKHGVIPTVEELCLYIGQTRKWMYQIRNGQLKGFSSRTKEIVDKVSEFMAAFDAKIAMTGKVRDAIYIFRSKNYHGMKDQQEVTLSGNAQNEQEVSKEELESWFLDDGKKIESTFVDEPK